jgi:hypothetical protein
MKQRFLLKSLYHLLIQATETESSKKASFSSTPEDQKVEQSCYTVTLQLK